MERSVLCIDVPAFPVAVARVVEPGLRGRPVAVAPEGSARALIVAASDEALREGVRAGMSVAAASRRCPGLILRPTDEALYRRAAAAVYGLLGGYTPLVEPSSLGRAYLDLTGTGRLFGYAPDAAARIRREIADRLRLRATVGVAVNKLVSRVAARVIRPDGLYDVFPGSEAVFLAPLPVLLLPGAAAVSKEVRFADLGIARVGDLVALTPAQARLAFGQSGERLRRQAQGLDETPVRPPSLQPSLDEEETLAEPTNASADLERVLFTLCERAGERLRRARAATCRLRVSLRHVDDVLVHDEAPLTSPAAADLVLFLAAAPLFNRARARRVAVRWIALRCLDLVRGERQMGLFGPAARAEPLSEAMDRLRGRFGREAVAWGRRRFGARSAATRADARARRRP
ncbi:MAG TPA: DNA polymerase IV [Candidatus Polarisedimenticolia bacterium]|nr:DNA polymerase IV [Candidatus Polarisedimenticolia bacterium]